MEIPDLIATTSILVVEDNRGDAEIIREILPAIAPKPFRVESVSRLTDALRRLQAGAIDLVLLDLGLPDSQGLQTLRLFRQAAPDVPVIVLTGTDDQELGVAALQDGAQDYLVKGQLNQNLLVRAINYALERHKTALALRESEANFRAMFELASIGMAQADSKTGRFLRVNKKLCAITGYSPDELLQMTFSDLTHPADQTRSWETNQRLVQGETPNYRLEKLYVRKDGKLAWVNVNVTVTRNAAGDPTSTMGTIEDITESKQAELELIQSGQKYRDLFEHMNEGFACCRMIFENGRPVDFVYLVVNAMFTTLTGLKNVTGKRVTEVIPGIAEKDPELLELYGRVATTGKPEKAERYVAALQMWFELSVYSTEQNIFVVTFDVITERKRTETALKLFRALIERSSDCIHVVDPATGRFLDCNEGACRSLGYTREELLRLTVFDVTVGMERFVFDTTNELMKETEHVTQETVHRRKDGTTYPVEVSLSPVLLDREYLVGIARDITERKQKTDELLWKTTFLEALVHSSMDGMLVVDSQNQKILQNQRMAELWKIPPAIADNPDDRAQLRFVTGQARDPAAFADATQRIISSKESFFRDEIELKDGTVLDRQSFLVQAQTGKCFGRVWTFRDITKGRQFESQFRQAQKMEAIGTLAGGIAHDFNNILAGIFGFGYLLQLDTEGNAAAQENIKEIMAAANRAKDLVQQILTFSRQREQKRQCIRLDVVVKEATKFLRASLPAQIQIELGLAPDAPTVLADATQIYQVVMNLGTNALHAMEGRPGQMTVKLASFLPDDNFLQTHAGFRPVKYARLTIADTGHGMNAKTLERIYEPFFTTKPVGKGTGLGLAVVHGIVQAHEGLILVESEPSRGTTFHLFFPAYVTAETSPTGAANEVPRGQGQKILVLDDEPALTKALQRYLQRLNYQVITSNIASEAIRLFRENPAQFDLVITDLTMPEMDGAAVARQLHDCRPDLPIILATGNASTLDANLLRDSGICELLEKPLSLPALARILHRNLPK